MTSLHAILPTLALGGVLVFVVIFAGAALYPRSRRRPPSDRGQT